MNDRNPSGAAKRKPVRMFFHFVLFFLVGTLLWYPSAFLTEKAVYPLLCRLFPAVFSEYNFVTEKEAFASLLQKKQFAEWILTSLLTAAIAFRFDNARYEYTVSLTDGQFRIADGMRLWLRSFTVTDVCAAVFAPIPLFALLYLPEKIFAQYVPKFLLNGTLFASSVFGTVGGYLMTVLLLLFCDLFAALYALGRYRVGWLSAFAE